MSCEKLGLYIFLLLPGICCLSALFIMSMLLMGVLLNSEKCCSVSPVNFVQSALL